MNTHQSPPVRLARPGMGLAMMLVLLLLISGCNGIPTEPTPAPTLTPITEPTNTPEPTSTPEPEAVGNQLEAREAVVRIEVRGAYKFFDEDTQDGPVERKTGGSGFIIDPSGLAVTNNHIVAGSSILQVYLAGEDEPRSAEVVGVDECADLALLDIEGEDLPFFDWYDDEIIVGMEVYAAGYSLEDEQYTLTEGIISKSGADGASSWGLLQEVLEHTARLNLGSSGGPLFLADTAEVVGVNVRSSLAFDEFLAVSITEARQVIEDIQQNEVTPKPIGLRARAFKTEDGFSGVWVESVTTGSEADTVGLKPGDILLTMGGLLLAQDGTLTSYCEILSNRGDDDPIAIEVLRPGASAADVVQTFEGQLGGRELAVRDTWVPSYPITDTTNVLALEVPQAWTVVDGTPLPAGEDQVTRSLIATSNKSAFLEGWRTPGVWFMQFPIQDADLAQVLQGFDQSATCAYQGREDYQDQRYTGIKETWTNCSGTNTRVTFLVFVPASRTYVGVVMLKLVGENDEEIRAMIEESFTVNE